MNYLAHAFLSFGESDILAGNMIADFVKGKKIFDLPKEVQAGIRLHRAIDEFTDHHEANRRSTKLLYSACGRYSGVFTDVIYDHFLALDKHYFNQVSLASFAQKTYHDLEAYRPVFPARFQQVFYYMEKYDWLSGYGEDINIKRSFAGIYHRAKYLLESEEAFLTYKKHYDDLHECYSLFLPDVYDFAEKYLHRLSK